ncbi:MAG: hypothetical protein HY905_20935 [Deltaproteobacteria bacterium]|nr:hypothetical protein [Deltaproteobacteria bacterium]
MKLSGFRVHQPWPRVEVWEWCEIRVELDTVVKHILVSVVPEAPSANRPRFDAAWLAGRSKPVAFRMPYGETRSYPRAHIVTTSISDAEEFLVSAYIPQGDGTIDALLRQTAAEGAGPSAARSRLDEALWASPTTRTTGASARDGGQLVLFAPSRFPLLWCSPDGRDRPPGFRHLAPEGEVVFDRGTRPLLTCDVEFSVHGRPVPRAAWVPLEPGPKVAKCGYWDGHRARPASALDDVPSELMGRLESSGTSLRGATHDSSANTGGPSFHADLEPRFLLRVPPHSGGSGTRERRLPRGPLRAAAVLLDSRCPVPLPPAGHGLPFVEDPVVARFVLLRTTSQGAYVPDAPPLSAPARFAPGSVLVGTLPNAQVAGGDRFCSPA